MQFVNIDGFSSSLKEISVGVPQGSILGPLLYIIYVNDFQYTVECTPWLYADDTCLLIQKSNLDDLQTAVDAEMDKILNWMVVNKLTINPKKSSSLTFQPSIKGTPIHVHANINGHQINSSDKVTYLGIVLDQYLNFKPHIEKVTKQIVRATGILWRVGRFLPVESMTNLYHPLIQPHLLYGLAIWGSPVFCDAQKQLQILQNNAVRAIVGSKKYDHVTSSYKNLKILKIHDLCELEIATLMHKYDNSKLPSAFDGHFVKSSNIHRHSTRSNQNHTYYIPKFRLARLQKSFRYTGVKIWNNIENKIKLHTISKFCKNYKNLLFQEY